MKIILPKPKILAGFLLFVVILFGSTVFGQTTGDYRSKASGTWTAVASWEYFDGSIWIPATNYPGQSAVAGATGTVTIQGGFAITLNTNLPNSFTSLVIGGTGSGKLIVSGSYTVQTTSVTLKSNGIMEIGGNNTISFPANTSFGIDSGAVLQGSGSPCSNNTAIYIGSYKVSACNGNGGGALSNFGEFTSRGGNGSASSNSPVCTGSTLTLTATPPSATSGGPYTYTYKWSGTGISNPTASSSPTYTISNAGASVAGTYTVEIKDNTFVTEASTTVVITPTPVGGSLDYATTPVCINSSVSLHLSNSIGSIVRWEKRLNSSNSWTNINTTTVNYTDTPSQSGTWEYRVLVGNGSCTPVYSSSISVVVNPELFITLGTNPQVTQLSTSTTLSYIANNGSEFDVVYTDPVAIAAGFTNLHGNVSGNSGSITLNIPYCLSAGVYNASIRVIKPLNATNTCSSQYYPFTIIVNSNTSGGTLSSDQVICSGNSPSNLVLTGNSGAVVKWQKSSDAAFTNPTDINSTATTLSGATIGSLTQNTYFRVITNYAGCNKISSNSILITVGPIAAPTIGTITQPTCATVKGSFMITNYNASYTYNIAPNSGVTQSGSTINAPEGSYTITASNISCGTSAVTNFSINAQPVVPSIATISSPAALCSGSSLNPTVPTVTTNGSAITSQGWQISTTSGGSTYGTLTLPYTVAFADNGKNIRYFATNSCGTTNGTAVAITVNDKPAIASITAPIALCAGGSLNPTAPTVTANGSAVTSQGWQISTTSGGSTYGTLTLPYTVTFADNGKNIRYFAANSCGTTNGTAVAITINDVPAIASITPPTALCAGSSLNPTAPAVIANGSALTSQGWQISTTSGGSTYGTLTLPYTVTFADNGKNIRYFATNSCGTTNGTAVAITVNPAPTLIAATQTIFACYSSPATIKLTGLLSGSTSTVDYTIDGIAQTSITGLTAVAGEASFDTRNLTAADNGKVLQITGVTVTSASPSCIKSFAGVAGIDITLNVKPDSGGISLNGGTPIASGGNTTFSEKTTATFSIAAVSGAAGYTWIVPTGWSITAGSGTNQITVTTGTEFQSGNVTVTANNMLCPSSLFVTLTSIAPPAPIPTNVISVKCGTLGSISFNNLPAGSWTLNVTKDGVGSTVSGSGNTYTLASLTGGNYTFTVTDAYGTSVSSASVNVDQVVKTWKGSGWFIGSTPTTVPTVDDAVVFDADYSEAVSVNSCSSVINPGKKVTIGTADGTVDGTGLVLNIKNSLDVQGELIFENNASLLQSNDNAVNNGAITYKRTTPVLKDYDYVYWSSPVDNQKLSDLWSSDRYYRYTTGNWEAQPSSTIMGIARGYIIRVRTSDPAFRQSVEFKGVPINGAVSIRSQGVDRTNLIGNPYPSAIDADSFILSNSDIVGNDSLGGYLYFWTHFSARKINNEGTAYKYEAGDYAMYNLTGGGSTAPSSLGTGVTPSGKIAAGQSFFVVSGLDDYFKFDNSLRFDNGSALDNSQFFRQSDTKKKAKLEKDRVWLNLTNTEGIFKQLLVGYVTGATNDFDRLYDGPTLNSNAYVDFYSVNNSKGYTIQGRALPFDKGDIVPLGYKSTIAGTFQIGIDNTDGGMVNQAIYLEDKLTNTIHDLKTGSYSFTTATGVFNDRFVLRYTNTSKLGTGDIVTKSKGFFVSIRNREIKINSFDQTINSVKVYDMKGSLLYDKNKVDKNEFIIDTLNASNQFMIVMVQLEDGKWLSEKIIFHD
ncbi:hypothetical protein [Flavobacterium sp. HJJ]|uniref:hypothetical protein n=1 Tax=Flavobacterium sp. HJJ TaxID=2783792 RepID=UPI00188D3AD0|nr:hypothetical protein [Flavobacterium sp. HJJ]MBF4473533.1 hypothetical protein [Flavobacterium sp. HJJ]